MIFLDKRDNSSFDYLTVSETAHEPPQMTAETDEVCIHTYLLTYLHTCLHTYISQINQPEKLSLEATMINQNFTQQVLLQDESDSRKTVCMYVCMYVYV